MGQLARQSPALESKSKIEAYLARNFNVPIEETSAGYLRTLCSTLCALQRMLAMRNPVCPFNHAPRAPDVSLPGPLQLALRPITRDYQLPLPLSTEDLPVGDWQKWYARHNLARGKSSDIFEGRWEGYYTYGGSFMNDQLDPPMMDVQFTRRRANPVVLQGYADANAQVLESIVAENCRDGVGSFKIEGVFQPSEDRCMFRGRKSYYGHGIVWEWRLEVTTFGLIGYCGDVEEQGGSSQNGAVWLWRR